jgi:hypothetical protein
MGSAVDVGLEPLLDRPLAEALYLSRETPPLTCDDSECAPRDSNPEPAD